MTPAQRLRDAAERLAGLDTAATPGPWSMFERHGRDFMDEGWSHIGVSAPVPAGVDHGSQPLIVAECLDPLERVEEPQADARLIAALRPLAPVIAGQLRSASVQAQNIHTDPISGRAWHDSERCGWGTVDAEQDRCECFDDALALADAILGPVTA